MKLKPIKLKWAKSIEAASWPEGSVVLSANFNRGKVNWHTLERDLWHRPDWITPGHQNFIRWNAERRYILLRLPKIEK